MVSGASCVHSSSSRRCAIEVEIMEEEVRGRGGPTIGHVVLRHHCRHPRPPAVAIASSISLLVDRARRSSVRPPAMAPRVDPLATLQRGCSRRHS